MIQDFDSSDNYAPFSAPNLWQSNSRICEPKLLSRQDRSRIAPGLAVGYYRTNTIQRAIGNIIGLRSTE